MAASSPASRALAVATVLAWGAAAAQPLELPPQRYNGAFRALELGAGPAFAADAAGAGAYLGGRFSTVLHLADVALGYHLTHVPDAELTGHRLGAALRVHPLSFFLLMGDWLGSTLGSVHVRLGFAPTLVTAGGSDWDLGAAWDWGVGFDVPLTALDAGSSFWLGAEYVRTSALDDGPLEDDVVQNVYLRIGYRLHGL